MEKQGVRNTSGYQKLKHINAELEKEINILVMEPESLEAHKIRCTRHFIKDKESNLMFGNR